MNLLGREKKLTIYGPPQLRRVIDLHFELANSRSSFDIVYVYTKDDEEHVLYSDDQVSISSFPVKHKIPTTGFKVMAGSKKRKLVREKIEEHDVPKHLRAGISDGKDYVKENGEIVRNEDLTEDPYPRRSYAYCSDTAYLPELKKYLNGINLMYHEASFLKEDAKRAKLHLHSTAEQAAMVAKDSNAGKLLIGHFSNKYSRDEDFLEEAKSVFGDTHIAKEGEIYEV
jgi:ribonuclease Z